MIDVNVVDVECDSCGEVPTATRLYDVSFAQGAAGMARLGRRLCATCAGTLLAKLADALGCSVVRGKR